MKRAALLALSALAGCTAKHTPAEPEVKEKMELTSSAFKNGGAIPEKYSAYGENVSPALSWSGAPEGTKSFALIMDDPDAPRPEPFVHWVLFNIPSSVQAIAEGKQPVGAVQGHNGRDATGYFGPRPPSGNHRYHFKLYALDSILDLKEGATKPDLLKAIEGHTLAKGELIGTYSH